jgi:hypothetical protein
MAIHVTPIPKLTSFAIPAITIGAAAAEGDANTAIRSNSTITGVALVSTTVDETITRFSGTAGQLQGYTSGGPVISDTGTITASAQPTVGVYANAQANVTGNNTTYTVLWANEIWDVGGNFASNAFTAPVTGKYLVTCQVEGAEYGSTNDMTLNLVTSNRTWTMNSDPEGTSNRAAHNIAVVDMDTSDTLTVTFRANGKGADTVDIEGASTRTNMTIFKVG